MKKQKLLSIVVIVFLMIISLTNCSSIENSRTNSLSKTEPALLTPDFHYEPSPTEIVNDELRDTTSLLENQDALKTYYDLLSNNGDCKIPCFWGITPGVNSSQDIINLLTNLNSFSIGSQLGKDSGYTSILHTENGYKLETYVSYLSSGTISGLNITIREFNYDNALAFGHEFNGRSFYDLVYPYTISGILTALGKPPIVQISTSSSSVDEFWQFYVVLVYPDEGTLVVYTSHLKIEGNMIIGCIKNAHIDMYLSPAGNETLFLQVIDGTPWEEFWPQRTEPIPGWLPIDKATDMTIDQFYETFRDNPDACLSTPAELWK